MGETHVGYAVPREIHSESKSTAENVNLQNVPPRLLPRRPKAKIIMIWHFLHLIAWFLLFSVGGPLLLTKLADHYLSEAGTSEALPCDVDAAWSSWSALFEINIRSREMSFTAAKLIDVTFDIVLGRGGQAILAWTAYRIYTDVLICITEEEPVRYDLFAAIAITPNRLHTLAKTTTSIPRAASWRSKVSLLWMLLVMSYIFAYPTLVSVATSPVATTVRSIKLDGNETAPLVQYAASASYSLTGTGLEGIPDPWIVSAFNVSSRPTNSCEMGEFTDGPWGAHTDNAIKVNGTRYDLANDTVTTCGFYYANKFTPFDARRLNDSGMSLIKIFSDQLTCVPDGVHYQWGASWEILVIIVIMHTVWLASLLLMWFEATRYSPLVRQGRTMSTWRAMLDLARPLLTIVGSGGGMLDKDQLDEFVGQMSLVKYQAQIDEGQDEISCQDIQLVSVSDKVGHESEVATE